MKKGEISIGLVGDTVFPDKDILSEKMEEWRSNMPLVDRRWNIVLPKRGQGKHREEFFVSLNHQV